MAPPAARNQSQSGPPQEPAPRPIPALPDAAPEGTPTAVPRPPAPLLQRPAMAAPAPGDAGSRDDGNVPEAAEEIAATPPFPRAAGSAIGASPAAHAPPGAPATLRDLLNAALINHTLGGVLGSTVTISVVPPDRVVAANGTEASQINLFLHRVTPNIGWRNEGLPSRDGSGRQRLSN